MAVGDSVGELVIAGMVMTGLGVALILGIVGWCLGLSDETAPTQGLDNPTWTDFWLVSFGFKETEKGDDEAAAQDILNRQVGCFGSSDSVKSKDPYEGLGDVVKPAPPP
eukprot:CAMPEP_0172585588 /NCGR_PEP_ID=MMETSP1068-20121228/5005_1 /TAXON_ID=35684 /ORGANISM="Pseudopedinella elastica, Strain CCMP716" /LENGTH=108 /DNA_ID=CAMNT_0013380105 /DNA_START=276 /DNA_END=598 /DNA_ORIENTATION=-